jgi:hypothetical protein
MAGKRPFPLIVIEWLLGGGALIALGTGAFNLFNSANERKDALHHDSCEHAHSAIQDDSLNSALDKAGQQEYLQRELKIAANCDKDVGR